MRRLIRRFRWSAASFGVIEITPTSQPTPAAGTLVTITGAGFLAPTSVVIGVVPCTNVNVVNPSTITATTGEFSTGGLFDVVVTNGDGQQRVLSSSYLVVGA